MKQCYQCKKEKDVKQFHLDNTKTDGHYSICRGCRRKRTGITARQKRNKSKRCSYCQKEFYPRLWQIKTNKIGKFYCCKEHLWAYKRLHASTFSQSYRPYILKRDNHRCVLCGASNIVHIHHIVSRGAGGKNEYNNLITVCMLDHATKAHGIEAKAYKEQFKTYTKKFKRPVFWDKIMNKSKESEIKVKKQQRLRAKEMYNRNKLNGNYQKKQKQWKKAQAKRNELYDKKYGKSYKRYIDWFKKKHGMTPFQYKYKKEKEYKVTRETDNKVGMKKLDSGCIL